MIAITIILLYRNRQAVKGYFAILFLKYRNRYAVKIPIEFMSHLETF